MAALASIAGIRFRPAQMGSCRLVLFLIAVAGLAIVSAPAEAQTQLQYQKRANRYEGVRARPVSGFDIELLAAQVAYADDPEKMGERFHIRFFLARPRAAHLVVRELDYRYFYWLDKVEPESPWRTGFANVFSWSTAEVVRQLADLRISDLGVVVRLDRDAPSAIEEVAPALFYQSQFPSGIRGYVFHFKLREDAMLKASMFKEAGTEPVWSAPLARRTAGRPFPYKWDLAAGGAPEGAYRLVLSGYLLNTNDPISQVVKFYHRPQVR
jgi:hypothetical protein